VELDERHRSRDCTQLTVSAQELEQLRAALGQVPEARWSLGPTLALSRTKAALRELFTVWPEPTTHFQIRLGRRSISGSAQSETEADTARAILDNLRVRAVRLAESLKPTGT
jgi:hypothetical protein